MHSIATHLRKAAKVGPHILIGFMFLFLALLGASASNASQPTPYVRMLLMLFATVAVWFPFSFAQYAWTAWKEADKHENPISYRVWMSFVTLAGALVGLSCLAVGVLAFVAAVSWKSA